MEGVIVPGTKVKRPIAGTKYDQRRKLSDLQIQAIVLLYNNGWSSTQIAELLKVCRSTVQYTVHPQVQKKKNSKHTAEYWKEAYLKNRRYRKSLESEGLI